MEKSKVDIYVGMKAEYFSPQDLMTVKQTLEQLDDEKFFMIQGIELQKPSTIFLIAIILGWERFWLDDVALGLLKIFTAYGCLIWWLVDIFTAKERAQRYNFNKFINSVSIFN